MFRRNQPGAEVAADDGEGTIRLPDGRTLAYATAGEPEGSPVMIFHGVPGSRLIGLDVLAALPGTHGLLFVAVDRPGIGGSAPLRGRRLLDWPADVAALADALNFERFSVYGASGGGPYALACALLMPESLIATIVVNSLAPLDLDGAGDGLSPSARTTWWLLGHAPGFCRLAAGAQARMARSNPDAMPPRMARRMAEKDRRAVDSEGAGDLIGRQLIEAFRQGPGGVARDLWILSRPWGFDLGDISMTVDLWQGMVDRNVPESMGRTLAASIPACRARFMEGEGHLIEQHNMDRILEPARA